MQSLLGKLKVLVSATMHGLVDQALQANSLAVFDEYIRQAQDSMETLRTALVDLGATNRTLKRKYDEASNEAAQLDLEIDQLLKSGKTIAAKAAQSHLNQHVDIAKTYKGQYEKEQNTAIFLQEVVDTLQAKVDILESQRDQVATLLDLVESKRVVAKSIRDVQSIADNDAAQVVENVKAQLDKADAGLEVATQRLSTQIDDEVGDAQLSAQLEARRQKLGLA